MFSETFTTKKRSIVLFDGRVTDVGIQKVTFPCKSERGAKGGKMGTEGDREEEERKKKGKKARRKQMEKFLPSVYSVRIRLLLKKNLVDWFPVARFRTIVPRSNLPNGTLCSRFGRT